MRKQNVSIGLFILLFSFTTVMAGENVKGQVRQLLQTETLKRADAALESVPMTVTATRAERSAGGIHDFYSEGDYWWENPQNPAGPFIRRDGETNPDNFTAHRHAMIRFSQLVGDLTSAWILTGDKKYTDAAMRHIRAWFIDQKTMMNPNLLYAQAIKGIATGRGIGIIDPPDGGAGNHRRQRTANHPLVVLRLPDLVIYASLRYQRDGSQEQPRYLLDYASGSICLVHAK